MLAKANLRSSSETPIVWSKRAMAFRTWLASVIGSLRCFGKANTLSGRSLRSVKSPCFSWGFQVVSMLLTSLAGRGGRFPVQGPNGSERPGFRPATFLHVAGIRLAHGVEGDGNAEQQLGGIGQAKIDRRGGTVTE